MSSVFPPHALKWDLLPRCCLCVLAPAAEEIYTGLEGAGFASLFTPFGFFKANHHQSVAPLVHKVIRRPKLMDTAVGLNLCLNASLCMSVISIIFHCRPPPVSAYFLFEQFQKDKSSIFFVFNFLLTHLAGDMS